MNLNNINPKLEDMIVTRTSGDTGVNAFKSTQSSSNQGMASRSRLDFMKVSVNINQMKSNIN
jgi:hypothetical protein